MNFKSYAQLHRDLIQWQSTLPSYDMVAGIPRSGMIAASMFAQIRNIPLVSTDFLLATGDPYGGGKRNPALIRRAGRILVIDDSSGHGTGVNQARRHLTKLNSTRKITVGAVYVTEAAKPHCDVYFEVIDLPRVWEWNLFHHKGVMARACLDMDGVLCRDPTKYENDDGTKYRDFMKTATPLIIPTVPVGAVVTSRLERYRPETHAWLDAHGVQCNILHMAQYPDRDARVKAGRYAADKAAVFQQDRYKLFVESNPKQAKAIHQLTGKPVYCTGNSGWLNDEVKHER